MHKHLQLPALLIVAGLTAAAQTSENHLYRSGNEWIQEVKGSIPAANSVKVISSGGAVRVQGAQQNSIVYTVRERVRAGSEEAARRELSRIKFSVSPGDVAIFRAESEGGRSHASVDFDIQVPAQTGLVGLKSGGGAIAVTGISGKVDAATGGGSVNLDQIGGTVTAASGGGSIEIGKVGGDVDVSTGGGSIHIDSAGGHISASSGGGSLRIGSGKAMRLETGGGSIMVKKCEGQLKAETGGGSLEFVEVTGPAHVETGGGGIKVWSIIGGLHAETGSGPITATLARGGLAFTESRLETSVGDIVVFVPDGLGVTIRASIDAARGDGIRSDFGDNIKVHRT